MHLVSGFLGVDLRRLPSVLSGSAFVQALKNTRSKLQAVVDLEREKIGISGVLTQNYRIFKTNFSNHKEKNRHVPKDSALSKPKVCSWVCQAPRQLWCSKKIQADTRYLAIGSRFCPGADVTLRSLACERLGQALDKTRQVRDLLEHSAPPTPRWPRRSSRASVLKFCWIRVRIDSRGF